ncbi:hypothetical protein ACFVW2_08665 [Streptomyces sp. NPDC058171]
MSDTTVLGGLSTPLQALAALTFASPNLPAPCVSVTPIDPDRLDLSFHPGEFGPPPLAAFEAWRTALGAPPDAVDKRLLRSGRTWTLSLFVTYAGATIQLIAYADAAPPGEEAGAA